MITSFLKRFLEISLLDFSSLTAVVLLIVSLLRSSSFSICDYVAARECTEVVVCVQLDEPTLGLSVYCH